MGVFKRISAAIQRTAQDAVRSPPAPSSPQPAPVAGSGASASRAMPPPAPQGETAGDLVVELGTPAFTALLRIADIAVPIIEKVNPCALSSAPARAHTSVIKPAGTSDLCSTYVLM